MDHEKTVVQNYKVINLCYVLMKGSRDPSVKSEWHADSCCIIVTVGLTRFTLYNVNYPI